MMRMLGLTLLIQILFPAHADEQQLMQILQQKQVDNKQTQKAINAGNERALLCKYCHGMDGNSVKNTVPNLASQNAVYLIRQFELFARGERNNTTMNQIAKLLTPEEKVNIALFFASQKVKPQVIYRPELAEQGKQIFNYKCFFCHGKEGHGKMDIPYIAGQPSEYIRNTLNSYQSTLVKRAETAMSRVARELKRDEVEALTAYLTSLH